MTRMHAHHGEPRGLLELEVLEVEDVATAVGCVGVRRERADAAARGAAPPAHKLVLCRGGAELWRPPPPHCSNIPHISGCHQTAKQQCAS